MFLAKVKLAAVAVCVSDDVGATDEVFTVETEEAELAGEDVLDTSDVDATVVIWDGIVDNVDLASLLATVVAGETLGVWDILV